MTLARVYRAKYRTGFRAYMALQAALLRRYLKQGGTVQGWCSRLAPAFQQRYGEALLK